MRSVRAGEDVDADVRGEVVSACTAAKRMPPPGWTAPVTGAKPAFALDLSRVATGKCSFYSWDDVTYEICSTGIGATHSVGLPIHVYALYEKGFRAHRMQPIEQNNKESAQLYADFAKVAEQNEFAWNYGQKAPSLETISTVTRKNRMICFPCTFSLNHVPFFISRC